MKVLHLTIKTCFAIVLLFGANANAQESEKGHQEKIKAYSEEACNCCYKISTDLTKAKIIEEINSCITSVIVSKQIYENLTGQSEEKEVIVDNDTIKSRNIIYGNENFSEIQAYMHKNCKAVKELMFSNNIKGQNSMSKDEKALKYYNEGLDYTAAEKYDKAIDSYKKAVKADSKFAFAWDNLGICYRRTGNYTEAVKCYNKSLELDPSGQVPLLNIGTAYEMLKDYKKAGESFEKLIAAYPENPEGYFGAGRIFYMAGDYGKGVDYMFKAYKKYDEVQSPYFHDAEQNLAYYYNDLKDKGKLDIFKTAARNNDIQIQD